MCNEVGQGMSSPKEANETFENDGFANLEVKLVGMRMHV
jgi:hypothetical protein